MAALSEIFTVLQGGVQAINRLTTAISNVFPGTTTTSTAVPSVAGPVTFTSSQPAGFMLVTLNSTQTVKIPYYTQ